MNNENNNKNRKNGSNGLEPGFIDLWLVPLDRGAAQVRAGLDVLSLVERQRAESFRFDVHKRRFIVRRAAYRRIAGRYCSAPPATLRLVEDELGKPRFLEMDELGLTTSASHAAEIAVFAVARAWPVGVDIEDMSREVETELLAERFFEAGEAERILGQGGARRRRAFFACWTAKEAYLKALGFGLQRPLDSFAVAVDPDEPAGIRWAEDDAEASCTWALRRLWVGSDHVVTVALKGAIDDLRVLSLSADGETDRCGPADPPAGRLSGRTAPRSGSALGSRSPAS
jgi:4'-phosphopantetheinyl transferase